MIEIRQTATYRKWFDSIKDRTTRMRIDVRIRRILLGNFGDVKPVGHGVSEIKIDYGPEYRIILYSKEKYGDHFIMWR